MSADLADDRCVEGGIGAACCGGQDATPHRWTFVADAGAAVSDGWLVAWHVLGAGLGGGRW